MSRLIADVERAIEDLRPVPWNRRATEQALARFKRRRRRNTTGRRVAAVVAIGLAVAGGGTLATRFAAAPSQLARSEAPGAARAPAVHDRAQRLTDGSLVTPLGAMSEVQVQQDSATLIKAVVTRGAARFQVIEHPRRLFRVDVGTAVLTGNGTTFTVALLDERVAVSVSTGRVRVQWADRSFVLGAREAGVFPPSDSEVGRTIDDVRTALAAQPSALASGCRPVPVARRLVAPEDEALPAARMRGAPAFELATSNTAAERARADLFAGAGFRRAIVDVQWQDVDPENPARLGRRRDQKRGTLALLRDRGIRPVILLDAYATLPRRKIDLVLAEPAAKGARQVRLEPASAARVVPGRTLLEHDHTFVTAVDDAGVASLSKGLGDDVPAGRRAAAVVSYPPFPRPRLADGRANVAFEEPLSGWLSFVAATMHEALSVLGSDGFEVIVFNGGGSPVLDVDRYRDRPSSPPEVTVEATTREILARTVAWLRDPRNGVAGVRIINGFTSRRGSERVGSDIVGIDARSRHIAALRGPGLSPRSSTLFPEAFASFEAGPVDITAFALWAERGSDGAPLAPPEMRRTITKAALRALAAYVGRGAGMLGFYEAGESTQILVDGDASGGETLGALGRFLGAFQGPEQITEPRSLRLVAASDCVGARQGDMANDDVAFFPFQTADGAFVAPVYLLTRDVARSQPPRDHVLDLEGVGGEVASVTARDPITGAQVGVEVVRRGPHDLGVRLALTDYPRLLEIRERASQSALQGAAERAGRFTGPSLEGPRERAKFREAEMVGHLVE